MDTVIQVQIQRTEIVQYAPKIREGLDTLDRFLMNLDLQRCGLNSRSDLG